ncbi:MAG: hypothetical protein HY720_20815 [Planctomycetes bacterium]|nr:hypothetical protein [Planctomycetota bacterium]
MSRSISIARVLVVALSAILLAGTAIAQSGSLGDHQRRRAEILERYRLAHEANDLAGKRAALADLKACRLPVGETAAVASGAVAAGPAGPAIGGEGLIDVQPPWWDRALRWLARGSAAGAIYEVGRWVWRHVPWTGIEVEVMSLAGWVLDRTSLPVMIYRLLRPHPPDAASPGDRARSSWEAVENEMSIPAEPGLYQDRENNPLWLASAWPHSQAVAAQLELAALTGDYTKAEELLEATEKYRHGNAYAPGLFKVDGTTKRLWDDNLWIGLDFMQAYRQTGDPRWLERAEGLYDFMEEGLHPDGGLYWKEGEEHMSRNAPSNFPGIQYGLELYQATGDPRYLEFAENLDRFTTEKLRVTEGPEKDLVNDNIVDNPPDGGDGVNRWRFSYNEGSAIGADVLFYQTLMKDGRQEEARAYLERANRTAAAALAYYEQEDRLWKDQPPAFNAIYFKNLKALDEVSPDPRYREALERYLDRAWREARDPETGLFNRGDYNRYDAAPEEKNARLIDQSAFVQMYAMLESWPKRDG